LGLDQPNGFSNNYGWVDDSGTWVPKAMAKTLVKLKDLMSA